MRRRPSSSLQCGAPSDAERTRLRVKHRKQKKAAWFPRRPFLSYGSHTLAGDFRTSAPGAYFPAVSWSVTAANRGSRDWIPTPTRWFPISVRWPY